MPHAARLLPEVQFDNPRLSKVGVEVIDLNELRKKLPFDELAKPQRVDFLLLLLIESGDGVHVVDFVQHAIAPGDVILVRPGQVQEWRLTAKLQGLLVLLSPEALGPSGGVRAGTTSLMALDVWPTVNHVGDPLFQQSRNDVQRLRSDLDDIDESGRSIAIARHGLVTLLLRLAHKIHTAKDRHLLGQDMALYRLFSHQLDALYMQRMAVVDHARRLGYSESTLSRACVDAVGLTAKQVIDRRVALEAKRLLAHSREAVAHIGHQLGFTEPTNFMKFFRRTCGETPLSFRHRFSSGRHG